jgi:flavin-dependent dehydrogenase
MIWDVAIIGSGPAGSAVAIHCRKAGLRTAIFTLPRRSGSSAIPETLPAAARPLLESLGIAEQGNRFGLRQQYAMSSAWGSDSLTTRHSICNPSGPGWFVDRPAFDGEIARQATQDEIVPVIHARIASASRERDHWVLRFPVPGEPQLEAVRAAVVVDATGRASQFARRIGIRRHAFDRLISVSTRAVPRDFLAGEALVESAPDGWWFSALTARGELSVSWFTEGGLLQPSDRSTSVMESRLQATIHTAARVASLVPQGLECRSARTDRLGTFAGDGWIAVGDAAVACDPLGSQGLLRALESAAMASQLIVRDRTGGQKNIAAYCEFQIDYLQRFLRDRHMFYCMEHRWPETPFWRRLK